MNTIQLIAIVMTLNFILGIALLPQNSTTTDIINSVNNKITTSTEYTNNQLTEKQTNTTNSFMNQANPNQTGASFFESILQPIGTLGFMIGSLLGIMVPLKLAQITTEILSTSIIEGTALGIITLIITIINASIWLRIVDKIYAKLAN